MGCPDVRAPPGGWAIRNDDSTSTLGCNQHDDVTVTSRTWQLVCVGHAWRVVGVTHNCTMTSYQHGTVPRQNVLLVVRSFITDSCLPLLNLVLINIISRSTGTVHTSAKAHLTSVAIRIRIVHIRDLDRHQRLIILFNDPLLTFPENFMQFHSEVFAQNY